MLIQKIVENLYPFNYGITGRGSEKAVSAYKSLLPFNISRYQSGLELNGWIIPRGWDVEVAKISADNGYKYDAIGDSVLGCAYRSHPFNGVISKSDLMQHCSWRDDLREAVVYDWTRLYRSDRPNWGLSIPRSELDKMPNDNLSIEINSHEYDSKMIVYDYLVKGQSDTEVVINAHNCHPFQANDDISGCAVAISLFLELQHQQNLRYSYRLLIGPELYGPMFWLNDQKANKIKYSILLKAVGNSRDLQIQQSFLGDTELDKAALVALGNSEHSKERIHKFREYYGNDETYSSAWL